MQPLFHTKTVMSSPVLAQLRHENSKHVYKKKNDSILLLHGEDNVTINGGLTPL